MIDLRSDTVTRPCPGMRKAMHYAEVGDDVFGEDPTTNKLQRAVAELLGKEEALFVSSGMMGNLLGLYVHTRRGDEVLLERSSHICNYESGAAGAIAGVILRTLEGKRGLLTADQVRDAVRPGYYWEPRSRLLCAENTVNAAGGIIYPLDQLNSLAMAARDAGLASHLDGARLWNATAATGVPEASYASAFDSVTVCLSKGLGAPVGSVFASSSKTVRAAHRVRKMLGGGMRQSGVLAAAGLYALKHHRSELAADHAKAQILAEGLSVVDSITVDAPETNIVRFTLRDRDALPFLETLQTEGVAMVPFGPRTVRATTHRDVSEVDVQQALLAVQRVLATAVTVP